MNSLSPRDLSIPKVAILLCTFQGQSYLADQLDSFAAQTHTNWEVWASDDGSKDGTRSVLWSYLSKWGLGRLKFHKGPSNGFAANFLSLACKSEINADYFAYSDQDDIWDADKLERAVAWLASVPVGTPAVYCSRTRLVDAENHEIGLSTLFSRPPSFANALMQNIGGGNTMVFNKATHALLQRAGPDVNVVTHDWWTYLVVMGCGGRVYYDPHPTLRYRQHGGNLVGANKSLASRIARIAMLWQGRFTDLNDRHLRALGLLRAPLTAECKHVFDEFRFSRRREFLPRVLGFLRSGVYRQTMMGNIGLLVATLFKKI